MASTSALLRRLASQASTQNLQAHLQAHLLQLLPRSARQLVYLTSMAPLSAEA